ncbi:Type 1 glutamine amidotransferase-like domain-containing protein [Bacillus sp. THAF10]|uniref:Type 1 glutamine amidotransferase-like domain-containing protein n=1 Tax=Bacillus sp. THAF10 TaxID=2587848 RepID=UPI001C12A2A2|nr:Type 1 glutamine amidotransferase-like domain-containing protein [Bacillus sp. THAF10]
MTTETLKIGYIPSTEDKDKSYFQTKVQYYRKYGVKDIIFFDLYQEFHSEKIEELLSCDIIHLSAGNPIAFRQALRARQMEPVLKKYFEQGGTIVGVSGGAVQLGKSAHLFQLFSEGSVKVELNTLGLVDFEFLPHYNRWDDQFKEAVKTFSKTTNTKIYAGNDGDGLIVEDGKVTFIGDIRVVNSSPRG